MAYRYWAEAGDLWVADDAHVVWRGRPDGKPVSAAVLIAGTDDAAVLLDAAAGPRNAFGDLRGWPHLLRVRPTGEVVWRVAADVASDDWWTSVARDERGRVRASTWSGYVRDLDADTGRVLRSAFHK